MHCNSRMWILYALCALMPVGCGATPKNMGEILAAAAPSDWRTPDPENTLYLELATGRVVIELAPQFAPLHVANIRKLARAGYFDGLAVIRLQDNYVAQWGDAEGTRALPAGVGNVAAEFDAAIAHTMHFTALPDKDGYAPQVGFTDGFPSARNEPLHLTWLAHCYGMVGVGRDENPKSSGAELYAVIGHAPRHLDRNVALVGRIVKGVELLSSLPRGMGELGFYTKTESPLPIRAVRIAADVPVPERSNLEILRTDTPLFTALVESRRNRPEAWFKVQAGNIELCNVPLPVRERSSN
jgi:cyclophilin family peptidyl-prolyl cis-trans isomerase